MKNGLKKIVCALILSSYLSIASATAEPLKGSVTENEKLPDEKMFTGEVDTLDKKDNIKLTVSHVISGAINEAGDEFFAEITEDVKGEKGVIIPKGSIVHGIIQHIQDPKKLNRDGYMITAFDYLVTPDGRKIRADYSCIGEGREGAKIKPDFLEFGGSLDRPFIIAGATPNTLSASIGTSFSSPLAVNKIGRLMAKSESITPHIGRTLLIHNAQIDSHLAQEEQGYGFCAEEVDDVLNCDDKKVTILYSGTLAPSQTVRLPVFAPQINNVRGNVTITWTVATIVDPFIGDPDAYTNSCIEDTFFPHEMVFMFNKKGVGTRRLNLLNEEHVAVARELLNTGYQKADFPVSHPSKKYWDETDLRAVDMKWDTVIRRYVRMRGTSLLNPAITLHAIARNGFGDTKLRYFAAVSIEAPRYTGSLYDSILQNYKNLAPIEIRNVNRVMVNR